MNKPNKISLIVPSRERLELIVHFLYTAIKGAKNINNIEIVLVVDIDDTSNLNIVPLHKAHKTNGIDYEEVIDASCVAYRDKIESFLNNIVGGDCVKFVERGQWPEGRSINNNEECYNFGASHATGDLLWALGDDCEILVDDWDDIILNFASECSSKVPDGAYYIKPDDGTHAADREVCAFPIISREGYNKMGCLTLGEFYSWMADFFIHDIFRLSKVERIFDISDRVKVAHYTKNTCVTEFKRDEDATNRKINLYTHCAGSMTHQYFDKNKKMSYVEKLDAGIE